MAKETTAVDWLAIQLYEKAKTSEEGELISRLLKEAKQIEKQEKRLDIISAFESGKLMGKANSNKTGDEYYFCNYIDNE